MSDPKLRLEKIIESIEDINYILQEFDVKITEAIDNKIIKPAIRMHLVKIAEQFSKLKDENAFKVLEQFSDTDLRGINAVRNYIAHDYDSVDDHIIEDVIRFDLPNIKKDAVSILLQLKDQ
ncbi:HepT-like ribonuclease domain-containing protein [Sulfurovum sp.]|uniref:HepT-like ribonuclease domain-containing protein n=1 Tax=Sulfurovum sp. TaxID=1969726 RepID=UPI0025F90CC7|nr:HepT-like ribonuclease domain-containing protein [Sulfurovum sp.]